MIALGPVLPWEPERKDARAVFQRLKADEQLVARAYALASRSWAAAANHAHLPEAMGKRVRRKLRRLGEQHRATASLPDGSTAAVAE
ncbi:hypothetical protein OG756_05350 [Streptomyces sp. NBC_01310]|uniref:hypothetical protein n=1 Tax=Streptomyces sp. NBC_01310 TaxID=2903820 RepID=UPI0035B5953B|nr:hypothetical protein OG756_05350 [Streptomyces sp. NBC_01310]